MRQFRHSLLPAVVVLFLIAFATLMQAQTLTVMHNFGVKAGDGNIPYASLVMDSSGNLYSTTLSGGAHNVGAVYRLSPDGSGGWNETTIYSFTGGADGGSPHAALVFDSSGNLYSTTIKGGLTSTTCNNSAPGKGCGVVFKLSPTAQGEWTETVLYTFTGASDGGCPYSGLVWDSAGNLYGTATVGGSANHGVVFKLNSNGTAWTETVLHSFAGKNDGSTPYAGVVFDPQGNLYGTTYGGGSAGLGVVYRLAPQVSGSWKEALLHTFQGQSAGDGAEPFAEVVLDKHGNIFGATSAGGSFNYGAVFELTRSNGFARTLLHSFSFGNGDGTFPNGVIFDRAGNLFGTTQGAGFNDGNGTIFKLTPGASGWTETILFTFQGSKDGTYPNTRLFQDSAGRLYGATIWGGTLGPTNGGVAYRFSH